MEQRQAGRELEDVVRSYPTHAWHWELSNWTNAQERQPGISEQVLDLFSHANLSSNETCKHRFKRTFNVGKPKDASAE